jgi:hypothetical protein
VSDVADKRPGIWIGHTSLKTRDLNGSDEFLSKIGLRPVFKNELITIFEMRGGTHIIMSLDESASGGNADFDFMVEDVDVTYESFVSLGLEVNEIVRGNIHDSFTVVEPGGNRITVNSTHVENHSLV